MNPYPERIEELHQHLERSYGQKDRQATEILLAAMLDATFVKPWVILETDWPSRETAGAWFTFGGVARTVTLSSARVLRAPACEDEIDQWMNTRKIAKPLILVESEWRKPQAAGAHMQRISHSYGILESQCVRLRVDHPRGDFALRPKHEQLRAEEELARLTRRVLDNEFRQALFALKSPKGFLYWCEVLQRLAPKQTNWEALTGQLAAIAVSAGRLYDEQQPRWSAAERVMRDTISYTTRWILEQTAMTRGQGIKAWKLFTSSGIGFSKKDQVVDEVRRLAREGVITARVNARKFVEYDPFKHQPWRYRLASRDYQELIDRAKTILI